MAKKTVSNGSCQKCGNVVDENVIECADCFVRSAAAPASMTRTEKGPTLNKDGTERKKKGEGVKKAPSGFPRGWHFKEEYVHTDGRVFKRGKEVVTA